jgi:hypothetical protein
MTTEYESEALPELRVLATEELVELKAMYTTSPDVRVRSALAKEYVRG